MNGIYLLFCRFVKPFKEFVFWDYKRTIEDGPCRDCVRLLVDLKGHVGEHHAESHVVVQKATIKAWFEAQIIMALVKLLLQCLVQPFLVKSIRCSCIWVGPNGRLSLRCTRIGFFVKSWRFQMTIFEKEETGLCFIKMVLLLEVGNARNKDQRMAKMVAKLRQYLN
jgi:hypothetical protein